MWYNTAFNPKLIIHQILAMQAVFYLGLGICLAITNGLFSSFAYFNFNQFFSHTAVDFTTGPGWATILGFLMCAPIVSFALRVIVERAKKCLDFVATIHILHSIVVMIYSGFPTTIGWWVIEIACVAGSTVLGEHLCMKKELREIPVTQAVSL